MNIQNANFLLSAVAPKQYPQTGLPEIAFAGRSNVGKSSFINKILNRKNFARISSKPGKTAQINFFNIDEALMIVDLPGYGYAAVSKTEKERWGKMMQTYLNTRENLTITALLVDSRHKPTADDLQMLDWIRHRHGHALVFVTKIDKLKPAQLNDHLDLIYHTLTLTDDDIMIPFSIKGHETTDDAWEAISELCNVEKPTVHY